MITKTTLEQVRLIRQEAAKSGYAISKAFWFPHNNVARTVLVVEGIEKTTGRDMPVVHFDPAPKHGMPFATEQSMITPHEVGKLRPPKRWGSWENASELV